MQGASVQERGGHCIPRSCTEAPCTEEYVFGEC